MFIIFGDKHRTETVTDGLRMQRHCPSCNTLAMFRERKVSKQFRLYFVDMFTHGTHHVLECGECGQTFVTDEVRRNGLGNDQSGTVFGHVQGLVDKGKALAADPRVTESLGRAQDEATKALGAAEKTVTGWVASLKKKLDP